MVRDIKTDLKKDIFKDMDWIDWLGLGSLFGSLPSYVKQGSENFVPWVTLNFFDQIKDLEGLYVDYVPCSRFV